MFGNRFSDVNKVSKVSKKLSPFGDWLSEQFGRHEVSAAASKTFCRPKLFNRRVMLLLLLSGGGGGSLLFYDQSPTIRG